MTATPIDDTRLNWRQAAYPYALLILTNFFWASNWVVGRGVHEAFPPVALSFWRWIIAASVLAPFALPRLKGKWHLVRSHWLLFLILGGTGVATFQSIIYIALNYTTAVNATILNASSPLVMVLMVWAIEGQPATLRQWLGMALTFVGVLLIVSRGDWRNLRDFHFNPGDLVVFISVPIWCLYSILLRHRPSAMDGMAFLFVLLLIGLAVLSPAYVYETIYVRTPVWSWSIAAIVIYIALTASVLGYIFWNRGVALIGPNRAGFTTPFQPVFTALLAVIVLGEEFHLYHAIGFAIVLAGWLLTTGLRRRS